MDKVYFEKIYKLFGIEFGIMFEKCTILPNLFEFNVEIHKTGLDFSIGSCTYFLQFSARKELV